MISYYNIVFVYIGQEVVECHPGLTFLQDSPEFHSRYVQTVSIGWNVISTFCSGNIIWLCGHQY